MTRLTAYWVQLKDTRICGPALTLLCASWLLYHLLATKSASPYNSGVGYGPSSWPEFALVMLVVASVLLCVGRGWRCLIHQRTQDPTDAVQPEDCSNYRVAVGAFLILLYGIGVIFVGFLIGSVLFLLIWMLTGGMRKPLQLLMISIVGTLAPLYLLVKVAYMPLPRGVGIFETATVWLYEVLRLF